MSDLTKGMWIDAWDNLQAARASFGEARSVDDKRALLQDMISICDTFKSACVGYSAALGYGKRKGGAHE